ncbi:MAG: hypothetical protein MUC81_10910 [Bacteroidia bacterium]|jgi:transcription elongation GreA/GreB family factor|nr:hypothetical protein [Bacteroidia bacterium]
MSLKTAILTETKLSLENKIAEIESALADLQASIAGETKSSAGDKYETSREMIAQEQLKLSKQLSIHQQHLQIIRGIDDTEIYNYVKIGSVVTTNMGVFFIAVSLGFITVADNKIALISSSSPIGNLMMGKKSGDKFNFNQTQYEILTVA